MRHVCVLFNLVFYSLIWFFFLVFLATYGPTYRGVWPEPKLTLLFGCNLTKLNCGIPHQLTKRMCLKWFWSTKLSYNGRMRDKLSLEVCTDLKQWASLWKKYTDFLYERMAGLVEILIAKEQNLTFNNICVVQQSMMSSRVRYTRKILVQLIHSVGLKPRKIVRNA